MLLAGHPRFYLGDSVGLTIGLIVGIAIGSMVLIAEEIAVGLSG